MRDHREEVLAIRALVNKHLGGHQYIAERLHIADLAIKWAHAMNEVEIREAGRLPLAGIFRKKASDLQNEIRNAVSQNNLYPSPVVINNELEHEGR